MPQIYTSLQACSGTFKEALGRLSGWTKNIELTGGYPYLEKRMVMKIVRARMERGTKFLVHNYFPVPKNQFMLNVASADSQIRGRSVRFVLDGLRLADELGSGLYTFHPGYRQDFRIGWGNRIIFDKKLASVEKARGNFYRSMETILTAAERMHMRVGVENLFPAGPALNYSFFCTIKDMRRLFGKFDSDCLGLLIDLGHLNVTARQLGISRDKFIRDICGEFTGKIFQIHLSDNDGGGDAHRPIKPGSWQIKAAKNIYNMACECLVVIEARDVSRAQWKSTYGALNRRLSEERWDS